MSELRRYSSRREPLDRAFLAEKLKGAKSYWRIAGYFASSIFELLDEVVESIEEIKILCNSELDPQDILVSKSAREAALKASFFEAVDASSIVLLAPRYRQLYELLREGKVEIRVVPRDQLFLHGKAGVITYYDGSKTSFIGSANETRRAFLSNYELIWEDASPKSVAWVEEEFSALWPNAHLLPDAIVEEINRIGKRVEASFEKLEEIEVPAATFAESPIYRAGQQLQPWQRSFVLDVLRHRSIYGKARLLLADEVGLGKTLSLAAAGVLTALLDDGPVLILAPAALTLQWQVEMKDLLGVPSAVWLSTKKSWLDSSGHIIRTNGAEAVGVCPYKIAIVSTGLINNHTSVERAILESLPFGTVILDEAHKARHSGGYLGNSRTPNNLLQFMMVVAQKAKNILLGTATPIQIAVEELWDLLEILTQDAPFVLGTRPFSRWHSPEEVLPYLRGSEVPGSGERVWELLRNPLPSGVVDLVASQVRELMNVSGEIRLSPKAYVDLDSFTKDLLQEQAKSKYFTKNNPLTRHVILRRREDLENKGLLDKVAVALHPSRQGGNYGELDVAGSGLITNHPFRVAYEAAEEFTKIYASRTGQRGIGKTFFLQRICSSFAAGRASAERLLAKGGVSASSEADWSDFEDLAEGKLSGEEQQKLELISSELFKSASADPKLNAVKYFLSDFKSEGKTWLELGCIIFSQYYDTAYWIANELSQEMPSEPIGVYAGLGRSGIFRDDKFAALERDDLKKLVKTREVRLMIATDAASEGLNLQTLGTLINIDLPWNPARLEQRLGRIKRFGQVRREVDMANLVYQATQDERVFNAISARFKDKFDIFGGLPSSIEDEWIEDEATIAQQLDKYIHLRDEVPKAFPLRDEDIGVGDASRWELAERVLSRNDLIEKLSRGWRHH